MYRDKFKFYVLILHAILFGVIVFVAAEEIATAEDMDALLRKLRHGKPEVRLSAIEALGRIRNAEALGELIGVIEDRTEDWTIKVRVVKLLGEIRNPWATSVLIKILDDPSFTNNCAALKWNAAIALGNFKKSARVLDALIDALEDRTLYVREAAIQSLGEIGSRKAVPYLIFALNDKSFAIRMSAIIALGKIGDESAIPFVKRVLDNDADPHIRDEAAKALRKLNVN